MLRPVGVRLGASAARTEGIPHMNPRLFTVRRVVTLVPAILLAVSPAIAQESEGWCCRNGELEQTTQRMCSQTGGRYYDDRATAERLCRQAQPKPEGPGQVGPVEIWCCADGSVSRDSLAGCRGRDGGWFDSREEAEHACRHQRDPEGPEGFCCRHGDIFPAPEPVCRESGGEWFGSAEEAEYECRREREGEEHMGFCCRKGDIFPAPEHECREQGGEWFHGPDEAHHRCRSEGDPHSPEGFCCRHSDVFPAPEPECLEEGGRWFGSPEEAEHHCRGEEDPHHEEGFCCIHGDVVPAPEHDCLEHGGEWFDSPEEAEHRCRREPEPYPGEEGYCCRDGDVFRTVEEECIGLGGRFTMDLERAELACGPRTDPEVLGTCCRDGELWESDFAGCRSARGVFFADLREAREQCAERADGWCCVEGHVSQLAELTCRRRGGNHFASREAAESSCATPLIQYLEPKPLPKQVPPERIGLAPWIEDVSPGRNAVPEKGSTQWGRLLALAGSGKEKIVGPVASWTTPNGPKLVEHLAARSATGDLLVHFWQPGQDWKAVNVSEITGRKIAGPPVAWTSKNGPKLVEHVAARDSSGNLLVFYWQPGQNWKVVDVTAKTGVAVSGGLTAWLTPVEHLAGRSPAGDLIVFLWQPHTDWVAVNASKEAGVKIVGDPISWTVGKGPGPTEHLAAEGAGGALQVFSWKPGQKKWTAKDVTAVTGRKVVGRLTAWTTPVEHVGARAPNGDLLVFMWQKHTGWVVINVSSETGRKVAGAPASWNSKDGKKIVEHLAVRGLKDELLVFYWAPGMSKWKVVDVSQKTGPRVAAQATAWLTTDGSKTVEHVAAQARNGDLLIFYWMPGQDWKPINVTTKAARRVIYGGAPFAGVWKSTDYGNTWRQLTRPQPAQGGAANGALRAPTVLDVAVSQKDHDVVLAAVRDDQRTKQEGGGVYYSKNGGASWKLVYQSKLANGYAFEASQVRFAPDDQSRAYAAVGNGIAFSTDGGATFKPMNISGLGNHKIWHIAVAPKKDGARRIYGCGDGTLWHSPDDGVNWYSDSGPSFKTAWGNMCPMVTISNGTAAQILEVEPGRPDHVLLGHRHGSNGPRYFAQHKKVLIDETDGKPCNSTVALTSANQKKTGDKQVDLGCGEGSVWLGDFSAFKAGASNSGAKGSWKQMPGPPVYWGGSTPSGRAYLRVHPKRSGGYLLFFADRSHLHVSDGRPVAGGWHRLDGLDISTAWEVSQKLGGKEFWNKLVMHVDPHDILPSPDLDITLRKPSSVVPAKYAKNRLLHEHRGGRLWAANDGGVYFSDDGSRNWKLPRRGPKTLFAVNVAGLAKKNSSGPALYVGTGDNDDFFTIDGGKKWRTQYGYCGDCGHWYADAGSSTQVLETGAQGRRGERFFVYTGSGGAFPDLSKSTGTSSLEYPKGYSFLLQGDGRVLVETKAGEKPVKDFDVYYLQDSGSDRKLMRAKGTLAKGKFTQVGPKLPSSKITQVQASGGHKTTVFYATDNSKLWRYPANSKGTAGTWQQLVPGNGTTSARRFFVNPFDSKNIYIMDSTTIRRSDDGGITWTVDADLNKLLTENGSFKKNCVDNVWWGTTCSFNDLVVDRRNPKHRFALGMAGVFVTTDGVNWTRLLDTAALPSRPVSGFYDPYTDPSDPSLYVACDGRGVLRIHHVP